MNIEKVKFEEKLENLYLKYCGDISAIQKELNISNTQMIYVAKTIKRVERRILSYQPSLPIQRSIASFIRNSIERTSIYRKMISLLTGREQLTVSLCCGLPVQEQKDEGEVIYYCIGCDHETKTKIIDHVEIYQLQMQILTAMQTEERSVMDFFDKAGYLNNKNPHINFTQNNSVIFGDEKRKKKEKPYPIDPNLKAIIDNMDGQGRSDLLNIGEKIMRGSKKRMAELVIEVKNERNGNNAKETGEKTGKEPGGEPGKEQRKNPFGT